VRTDAKLAATEVLRALQADDRPATADEQQVLARWSSWGAVREIFDDARRVGRRPRAAARSSERCGVAPYVPGLARGRWKS
jgi:hypothetical protein